MKKIYIRKLRTYEEVNSYVLENIAVLKQLYLTQDLTARKVAEKMNVEYSALFQKALFKHIGPKGLGKGGARQGSGNKKGVKFCGTCRQKKENCTCE